MNTPSEKQLVSAVLTGDKAAYGTLYDRYAPMVRAICYDFTKNLADAQDLTQDVFMRAYEKLDYLRDPDHFGRWLIGIARLRCREWYRQRLRRRDNHVVINDVHSVSSDPSNDGQIERLREMITALPEKERLALHNFYLQGKSVDKARNVIGMSRSGFYRVLERARKRLEQLLTEE